MSFMEESESIRSKLHLSKLDPKMLIGIGLVMIIVLVLLFQTLWGAFCGSSQMVSVGQLQESEQTSASQEEEITTTTVYVHVAGAVANPGLYSFSSGSRVASAVEAAGGFTSDANTTSVNLARELVDGEQIVVASISQETSTTSTISSATNASTSSASTTSTNAQSSTSGLININTATAEQLTTLDGIGDATAQKIIADRQANGAFKTISDITRVSGIGDKRFEAIKDKICV